MGETLSFKDTVEDNGCRNNLFGLEQNMDRIWLEKYRLSNRIFKLPNFNTWKSQYFIELPTRKLDWVSDRMTDFQFKRCQNMMSRGKKSTRKQKTFMIYPLINSQIFWVIVSMYLLTLNRCLFHGVVQFSLEAWIPLAYCGVFFNSIKW